VTLTAHFGLTEFLESPTAKAKGIPNEPDADSLANLERTAALLEEVRALLGVPLKVTSGYRSPKLNRAVGGTKGSAHCEGRAADVAPVGLALKSAFAWIVGSEIAFDQVIIERTVTGAAWLHIAVAREGAVPRRETLSATGSSGAMTYHRVAEG